MGFKMCYCFRDSYGSRWVGGGGGVGVCGGGGGRPGGVIEM